MKQNVELFLIFYKILYINQILFQNHFNNEIHRKIIRLTVKLENNFQKIMSAIEQLEAI